MPRGLSRKVRIRSEEVAKLLRTRGCVTLRGVEELGFTRSQAERALEHLAAAGRAVCVYVGDVRMWCYSNKSAVRHLRRLRHILHGLICAAKMKYVTSKKALELVASNKAVKKVFGRYIRVDPSDTGALQFLNGLLKLMYGEPVVLRRRKPVYFADCGKKPRPLPPSVYGRKEYTSIQFKAEAELKEALFKAAAAEGTSASAVTRRAVEHLLKQYSPTYKALELKNRANELGRAEARKKEKDQKEENNEVEG